MRILVAILLVAAKIAALGLLPILILGHLFFLSSQSVLTHFYVVATAIGLILTIVATPSAVRSNTFRTIYGITALAAIVLGGWKVREHLLFFEGPQHGAATMSGVAALAVLIGLLGCQYFNSAEEAKSDA